MKRFDITLKTILQQQLQGGPLARLLGFTVCQWLDAELPEVRSRQADLLGWTDQGDLVQVEVQSFNDPGMALRLAEYALAIYRRYSVFPHQIVLYVGPEPLRMSAELKLRRLLYTCEIIDIRTFDPKELLESPRLSDNVLAILTNFSGKRHEIRQILNRIAAVPAAERKVAIVELMMLAGLRRFGGIIEGEIRKMPILIDWNTHTVFGPHYRRGLQEGMEKGADEGVRRTVTGMVTRRFGKIPVKYSRQLAAMSSAELEALSDRLFDAGTVADLFVREPR